MSAIILFLTGIAAIAAWWLTKQRVTAKPWLEEGVIGDLPDQGGGMAAKVGLGVFLAVAGSLFTLMISAYFVRKDLGLPGVQWPAQPMPNLLWLNTGVLVLSSFALHWTHSAAKRGHIQDVRNGVSIGGASALLFIIGQLAAWRQLAAAGYFAASSPAAAFFYLITGSHGLHVAGGLVALGRTGAKAWRGAAGDQLRLSVGLCAAYWHFLLLVWLILFAVLAGWADDFIVICRAVVS